MKIYLDEELKNEVDELDFDILPAGEVREYKFYVLNDVNATLKKLKFSVAHEELKIIEAPEELAPHAIGELIIEWSPTVTLKEGLHAKLGVDGIMLFS